jgi:hypothetical protein
MSDIANLVRELKDHMTPALQKMGNTAHQVFSDIEKDVVRMKKSIESATKSMAIKVDSDQIKSATKEMDLLLKKMQEVNTKSVHLGASSDSTHGNSGAAQENSNSAFSNVANITAGTGNKIWGAVGALKGPMGAVGDKALEIGKEAYKIGTQDDKSKTDLSFVVGDNEAGTITKDMNESAAFTPYRPKQMMPGIKGMLSSGIDYGDAKKSEWALGNAVTYSGGSVQNMASLSAKMGSAAESGKMDKDFYADAKSADIPIDKMMSDYLKVPMDALQGMFENGKVSFDTFNQALNQASGSGGMFEGAMDKMSNSIEGKSDTIGALWDDALGQLAGGQTDNIKALQDDMIAGLKELPALINEITPYIDKTFKMIFDLMPNIHRVIGSLMEGLKPIADLLFSDTIKSLLGNIMDFGTVLMHDLKPVIEIVAYALGKIGDVISWVLKKINGFLDFSGSLDEDKNSIQISWKDHLANDSSASGQANLQTYLEQNYNGHVQDWMNSAEEETFWKKNGKFDESLAPKAPDFTMAGLSPMTNTAMLLPSAQVKNTNSENKPPKPADHHTSEAKKTGRSASTHAAEGIVNGGRKQVVININRAMIEKQQFTVGSMKEAESLSLRSMEENLLRILQSAAAAAF